MGGESIWAFCAFVERECEVIQVSDTDFQELLWLVLSEVILRSICLRMMWSFGLCAKKKFGKGMMSALGLLGRCRK